MTPLAKELRRQGITVAELARRAKLNNKYLYQLAQGRKKTPSWIIAHKISVALNVKPESIFYVR